MRRGFVLLAVMIGLSLTMLVTLALLQLAQTETSGAHYSANQAQSHALMRSGIDAIASRLSNQREVILAGQPIEVDAQYTIYEDSGRLGVVRLLPVGRQGALTESESAKLDINSVTAEQLVATGLVEDDLAQRIVQFRDAAPGKLIHSINELAGVPGMTNELLFGSLQRVEQQLARVQGEQDERDTGIEQRKSELALGGVDDEAIALADVFTVFSIEANVTMDDSPRVDLSTPRKTQADSANESNNRAGETDGEPPDESLDPSFGFSANPAQEQEPEVARWLRSRRPVYAKESEIAVMLGSSNIAPEDWPDYFDACTTSPGALRDGRLDINTATKPALLAIPGMTVERAEAIVAAQDSLSDSERASACWPVLLGIMQSIEFARAADHITNRSCSYRMRLAAGEVSEEEPDGPLRSPVIYEVVFDLGGASPRVAYLRDITLLPTMLTIASRAEHEVDGLQSRFDKYALSDEIEAWDRQFNEPEASDEPAGATPTQPPTSQPRENNRSSANGVRSEGNEPTAGATSETESEPVNKAPAVRRLGRWLGGS